MVVTLALQWLWGSDSAYRGNATGEHIGCERSYGKAVEVRN